MTTDEPTPEGDSDVEPPARYRRLTEGLFPRIIAYTIHPIHILALLVLWISLLLIHSTLFELVGGNYTNGLSAMAASIVLLQQTRQHREVRTLHRKHHELLTDLHRLMRSAGEQGGLSK